MLGARTKASALGLAILVAAAAMVMVLVVPRGSVGAEPGQACSIQRVAGSWLFGTDVGHHLGFGGDITALGTMNIDREGNLSGVFDVTVSGVTFLPGNTYAGTVTVNPDCTGTLTFVTSGGNSRTDSIAVLSQQEMWGMSQDPGNLWTYDIRRISGPSGD